MPSPEPWLSGSLTEVPAVPRAVLHALELAREDVHKWVVDVDVHAAPLGLAPVAFHLKHIARSLDRLLTYAEGGALSDAQMAALKSELDGSGSFAEVLGEFDAGIAAAEARVRALAGVDFEAARGVGKKMLPTTVGGLLVHVADHTLRHVGQVVTTVKVVKALR